jgi:hypothetical protein
VRRFVDQIEAVLAVFGEYVTVTRCEYDTTLWKTSPPNGLANSHTCDRPIPIDIIAALAGDVPPDAINAPRAAR